MRCISYMHPSVALPGEPLEWVCARMSIPRAGQLFFRYYFVPAIRASFVYILYSQRVILILAPIPPVLTSATDRCWARKETCRKLHDNCSSRGLLMPRTVQAKSESLVGSVEAPFACHRSSTPQTCSLLADGLHARTLQHVEFVPSAWPVREACGCVRPRLPATYGAKRSGERDAGSLPPCATYMSRRRRSSPYDWSGQMIDHLRQPIIAHDQ